MQIQIQIQDNDNHFKALESAFDQLKSIDESTVHDGTETARFFDFDAYLTTSQNTPVDDEEILAQFIHR